MFSPKISLGSTSLNSGCVVKEQVLSKTYNPNTHRITTQDAYRLFSQNWLGQIFFAQIQYFKHTLTLLLPVCSPDTAKTPKMWPSSFERQSQSKDIKIYYSVFNSRLKVLSFSSHQKLPYESQSTYHPSWGRALPLCEEIFTLLKSQAATRRRSYWLLKLKGFLQDSIVETSSAVYGNQL